MSLCVLNEETYFNDFFFAYFRKFAPELPVVLYHGSQAERQELRSKHLDEVHIIKVSCISANSFLGN